MSPDDRKVSPTGLRSSVSGKRSFLFSHLRTKGPTVSPFKVSNIDSPSQEVSKQQIRRTSRHHVLRQTLRFVASIGTGVLTLDPGRQTGSSQGLNFAFPLTSGRTSSGSGNLISLVASSRRR
jgi:hypothetical protein